MLKLPALLASAVAGSVLLSACVGLDRQSTSAKPVTFADHQRDTHALVYARRAFQLAEKNAEQAWNSPREWRPVSYATDVRPTRGILLVHGLGDSPWSFHDVGQALSAQGFLVRTVLLPGHGTRPEDLLDVTLEQWRKVVREQAETMRQDVDNVFLGGFSTGANLVLEYAYGQPDIAGLVLFSPGFRSSSAVDWVAPLVAYVRPWLVKPGGRMPTQNLVRYLNTPTNGFAQFYRSSRSVQHLLHRRTYDKPVFMAVARHDSVLDTPYLLDVFQRRFTHPSSRLVWYGELPATISDRKRVLVREDRLPELRISQFSHMGLLFSPLNPLYGKQGNLRICWNGQSEEAMRACEQRASVWYSDWGYREEGKVHARLTFNPYFDWQTSIMASVLNVAVSEQGRSRNAVAVIHATAGRRLMAMHTLETSHH